MRSGGLYPRSPKIYTPHEERCPNVSFIFVHTFKNGLQVGHRDLDYFCISVSGFAEKVVGDSGDGWFPSVTRNQVEREGLRT